MEDQMLEKAVEDVQLIRNVMERSTDSLNLMYRVFICWGATFAAIGAVCNLLCLLWPGLLDALVYTPFLAIVPKLLIAISTIVIFFIFRKGMLDKGLNRQFTVLWLTIFLYNEILPSVSYLLSWPAHLGSLLRANMYTYFVPGISMLLIALGMFCIFAFTRVKPFGWMSLVSLLLFLVPNFIPGLYTGSITTTLLDSLVSPLTLLTAGILLWKRSQRKVTFT